MKRPTPDQAAVACIVEAVGVLADRSEFDALARLYAEEVTVDYSSLNGQAASVRKPLDLMAEWASVLPGFDRTRHQLSNIEINISGETADAEADVAADHWIGGEFWQVEGRYIYELKKYQGRWGIAAMTFVLENETGSRDVFGPAIQAAQNKSLPGSTGIVAERNKAKVRLFFKLLEKGDISAMIDLFAEDGRQVNPYTGGVFPSGATGREELLKYWTPVPGNFDSMDFQIREILATEDVNVTFVHYQGTLTLKGNAGLYQNTYFSTFRFNTEGKITEYVEIFDPVVAARSFGVLEQVK